jgi:hypothetical protein
MAGMLLQRVDANDAGSPEPGMGEVGEWPRAGMSKRDPGRLPIRLPCRTRL